MGSQTEHRESDLDATAVLKRRRRYWRGVRAEWVAAIWLTVKGYRVLSRRWKSRFGEIDLIAVRGNALVFVEVKQRATLEAAQSSVSSRQRARVREAADLWLGERTRYQDCEIRFDLVFVVPGLWPQHIVGGL